MNDIFSYNKITAEITAALKEKIGAHNVCADEEKLEAREMSISSARGLTEGYMIFSARIRSSMRGGRASFFPFGPPVLKMFM